MGIEFQNKNPLKYNRDESQRLDQCNLFPTMDLDLRLMLATLVRLSLIRPYSQKKCAVLGLMFSSCGQVNFICMI